jgi:hypothetical protein
MTGSWIGDITYNLNHELLNEYFKLWAAIEMVGIDLDDTREDTITWTLENSGEYSAKSAYEVGQITSNYPVLIWKIWAPAKCKFFVWLLLCGSKLAAEMTWWR